MIQNLTAGEYTIIASMLAIVAQNYFNNKKLSNKPALNGVFNKLVADFAEMKQDIKEVKSDIQIMKIDIYVVKTRLDEGEKRMDRIEEKNSN